MEIDHLAGRVGRDWTNGQKDEVMEVDEIGVIGGTSSVYRLRSPRQEITALEKGQI